MPSETFLRLPEEKRVRFLDAAWNEFTRVSFADASINQIIQKAEIPRGSFYQYFKDKDDLFQYLLSDVWGTFIAAYEQILKTGEGDLMEIQLQVYDMFLQRDLDPDPLDRCVRILQMNAGMDIRRIVGIDPRCCLVETLSKSVDPAGFRQTDEAYIRQVFAMSLMALAFAVVDTLMCPENWEKHRAELQLRLEIIKYGSLRQECPAGAGRNI